MNDPFPKVIGFLIHLCVTFLIIFFWFSGWFPVATISTFGYVIFVLFDRSLRQIEDENNRE